MPGDAGSLDVSITVVVGHVSEETVLTSVANGDDAELILTRAFREDSVFMEQAMRALRRFRSGQPEARLQMAAHVEVLDGPAEPIGCTVKVQPRPAPHSTD